MEFTDSIAKVCFYQNHKMLQNHWIYSIFLNKNKENQPVKFL
jgi:hypothetical protein